MSTMMANATYVPPDQDTTKLVTGTLRIGESIKGPFMLTYLAVADAGITAEIDHVNVPLPLTGRLYIGEKQTLQAFSTAADSLGRLLYSGYRL